MFCLHIIQCSCKITSAGRHHRGACGGGEACASARRARRVWRARRAARARAAR